MSIIKKMESDVESVLDALVAPTANISPQEAADQIYTIGIEFFNARSSPGSLADGEDDDAAPYNGPTTPGVPTFFYQLWETVISHVRLAPVDEQARNDRITRLLEFISQVKAKPQPDGKDWLLPGAVGRWDDLPRLAWSTRDYYDFIDSETTRYGTSTPESQAAIAGAVQLDPQHLDRAATDSDIIRLKRARYQWLTLQEFISRRWRECGTDECDYAIWALRPALEDWPESPPTCDTKCETFEETAGYLAFRVEAACIWICNAAPLMYQCTEIFGPNGNPDWPENAGAPGRGGRRWNGVDGYDREHKRWQLWKDVLGEVVEWCDRAGQDQMKSWKVKDAAVRALEAMKAAEGQ